MIFETTATMGMVGLVIGSAKWVWRSIAKTERDDESKIAGDKL